MEENNFIRVHANVMARIWRELEENEGLHLKHYKGVKNSQISALVAVLLKEPEIFRLKDS